MIYSADAAAGILCTCDIKFMSGSQLRPYGSIEGMRIPKGFNVNCIVNRLSKVRIFCTMDIPAAGNHQSGEMETSCPEFGNHLDWVIVSRSEMTVLSSPQPHCGAKQALQYRNF